MVLEGINQALPIMNNCRSEVVPHFPKILFAGLFTICFFYVTFASIVYVNKKAYFLYQLSELKME